MDCVAELKENSQIIVGKPGGCFGNITPVKRLETLTGLAGNFHRREHNRASHSTDTLWN